MNKILVVIAFLLSATIVSAQKDSLRSRNRDGFYLGVNFGGYIASDAPAQYYNGAPDKINKASNVLSNVYTSEALIKVLPNGFKRVAEYPTMKYDPMVCIGGHVGYNVSQKFSLFAEINFVTLTAKGNLKLELDKLADNKIDPTVYKSCPITAVEKRADINIGARTMFAQEGWFLPFVEYGVNFNITNVKSHSLYISNDAGNTFTGNLLMFDYVNGYALTQGGNGYGLFFTAGGLINMPSRVHLHIGVQGSMKSIGLTGMSGMNPHAMIFLRCNY